MKKILLLLFVVPLFAFSVLHKYYISLTEIKFNKSQQSVEIITNVFIDDIEVALNKEFQIDAQISNPNEIESINDYFLKYLEKKLKININGMQKKYRFIGKEYEGNIVYFYLEIRNIPEIKSIDVKNTILTKYFSQQQNLIKLEINNRRESMFLNKQNNRRMLIF